MPKSELLSFEVLTPEKRLLSVDSVAKVRFQLLGEDWVSVYPKHAPLLAETLAGPIQYALVSGNVDRGESPPEVREIAVDAGIVRVQDNHVEVFTSGAYFDGESDLDGDPSSAAEETEAALTFDRLARVLLVALNAQPEGVLADDG